MYESIKRPRFLNILLKRGAVFIAVLFIISILVNYIASLFFQMAFSSSLDSYSDELTSQLDNTDFWNADNDYNRL